MSTESLSVPARTPGIELPGAGFLDGERRRGLRLTRVSAAVLVGVLILVSLWFRTRGLHVHLWVDEALSIGIASHPISQLPSLLRQDGSPPLYYLLLHFWMLWRGRGEAATHELSLLIALVTIPVAYWAGASLWDRRTGAVCATLAALVPYLTAYAQETRMYALLTLLALLVAATFVHAFVRRRRRYLPAFGVSLAAALYTHNWALFLAAMAIVAFVVCLLAQHEQRRALLRDGILGFGLAALLFAPWVPTLLYQAGHTGAPWAESPVLWSLSQGLYATVGGRGCAVALLFGAGAGLITLAGGQPGGSVTVGRSPRALARRGLAELQRSAALTEAICLALLGFGTLFLAFAYAKTTPAWAPRYLAVIVGPLLLLFGMGIARGRRLGLVALALTVFFWVIDPVPDQPATKSNVAEVAADLRPHLGTDPIVLSTQPEQVPTIAYYLPGVSRFYTPLGAVPDPRVVDWIDALKRFERARPRPSLDAALRGLRPGQRVLLVVPYRFQKTPLWMHLIYRYSVDWQALLDHDRQLRVVDRSVASWTVSGVPVAGIVYARR